MQSKCNYFLWGCAMVLTIAACAKLVSSFGVAGILQYPDPVFSIPFQDVMRVVGTIELIVALICLFNKSIWLRAGLVAWLATNFLLYRLAVFLVGYRKPCSCLGNLTDALHIKPQIFDTAMKIILAYLLIGSYATLFWLWKESRKTRIAVSSSPEAMPKSML